MVTSGALYTLPVDAMLLHPATSLPMSDNILSASGFNGDVRWTLSSEGVLSLGSGTLQESIADNIQNRLPGDPLSRIRKIIFTDRFSTKSNLFLFCDLPKVESIEGLKNMSHSEQRSMRMMFCNTPKLKNLDLSSFNTSKILFMNGMFSGDSGLEQLDLQNFDMRGGVDTTAMFEGTSQLKVLTLGKNFRFNGWSQASKNIGLPNIEKTDSYTGYWQDLGDGGTPEHPKGEHVFTSDQLMENYDGETMAGTYVWQPTR
ncbi:BspA family leucine-rich repeat surface protein [Lactococcus garvieae]|uniref:BspA family leucine-rich repeat surface protein n=1 Tax=Lactococcus garvieae TaxID=1363 RepID=UPI003853395A